MKQVIEALNAYRYRFRTREELRDAVGHVFERQGIVAMKGCHVGRPHLDFLVDGWALLVAVDGSLSDVTRTVMRAAMVRESKGVVLVTSKVLHTRLPKSIWGKPAAVVHAGPSLGNSEIVRSGRGSSARRLS